MRKSLATFALIAAALTAAGCGSSSSPAAKLAAKVEPICTRHNTAIAGIDTTILTPGEVKTVARKRAAVEQATLTELSSLTAPASSEPGWSQFIAYRRSLINDLTALGKIGLTGLTGGKLLESAGSVQSKMFATAKRAGFKECSQAG